MDEPTPDMADEAPDKGTVETGAAGDGDPSGPAAVAASPTAAASEAPVAGGASEAPAAGGASEKPKRKAAGKADKTGVGSREDSKTAAKAKKAAADTSGAKAGGQAKAPKKAGPKGKAAAKAGERDEVTKEDATPAAKAKKGDAGAKPAAKATKATAGAKAPAKAKKAAGKAARGKRRAEEPEPELEVVPAPPPIVIPDEAKWYVVHTYSGYENKVKRNLEHRIESMGMLDRIFQVVVPVEEEVDIKDGQRRLVERKIFPGYVLVRMILDDDSWSVVRNTPGVTGFVGSSSGTERLKPTALRPEEVDGILRRMDAEEPTIRVTFRQGQNVRIVDGPFTDFHGVVDAIDMARGKVRLMVNFFGRETPVELDFLQVEKV